MCIYSYHILIKVFIYICDQPVIVYISCFFVVVCNDYNYYCIRKLVI